MGHPATAQRHTSAESLTALLKNPKTTNGKSNLEQLASQKAKEYIRDSRITYYDGDDEIIADEITPKVVKEIHPTKDNYIIEDFTQLLTKTKPDYYVHDVPLRADMSNPYTKIIDNMLGDEKPPTGNQLVWHENAIGGFHNNCLRPGFVVDSVHKDFAQHFVYAPKTTLKQLTESVNPQTYISQKLAHGIITHIFSQKKHRRALYPTFKEYANKAIWDEQHWRSRIRELVPGDETIAEKVLSGRLAEAIGFKDELTDKMRFTKYSSEIVTPSDNKPRLTIHEPGVYKNHTLYGVNRANT